MRALLPALFLVVILTFLAARVQARARGILRNRPQLLLAVPPALTALFAAALLYYGAFHPWLAALMLVYTAAPVAALYRRTGAPGWMDLAAVVWLWLPLEFAVGARWVPRAAQGPVHTVAYGVAITLALLLFLVFRSWKGMKYNLPRSRRDLLLPLAGFVLVAPVLIGIGLAIGFIEPFHMPRRTGLGRTFVLILAATALPEEILFRSLLQNWMVQKFGPGNLSILAAAVLFGCSHLNNAPGPVPNWRYAIEASIAGFAFGKVFQKAGSVFSSALLHAMVNTVKHVFF